VYEQFWQFRYLYNLYLVSISKLWLDFYMRSFLSKTPYQKHNLYFFLPTLLVNLGKALSKNFPVHFTILVISTFVSWNQKKDVISPFQERWVYYSQL
jgi:hypothetical protein